MVLLKNNMKNILPEFNLSRYFDKKKKKISKR